MKNPFRFLPAAFLLVLCVYFFAVRDPSMAVFILIISSWSAAVIRWNTIRGEYDLEEYLRKTSAENSLEISSK